jgi:hypothetical protein
MRKNDCQESLTRAGIFLACMALFIVVSLMVADTAMKHPTEAAAFRSWMQSTRYWLADMATGAVCAGCVGPLENPACAGFARVVQATTAAHQCGQCTFYRVM